MQTFNFSDLNEDLVFLFTLCYDNNLNFNRLYRLYKLSDKVFWGYIGALTPIFKIGVKKVNSYAETAYHIMNYIKETPYSELSNFDKRVYELMSMFIKNIYLTGDLSKMKAIKDIIPIKRINCCLYGEENYKEVSVRTIDDFNCIKEILIDGDTFYKTSTIEAIIDRHYGDMKVSQIENKTLRELETMILNLRASQNEKKK